MQDRHWVADLLLSHLAETGTTGSAVLADVLGTDEVVVHQCAQRLAAEGLVSPVGGGYALTDAGTARATRRPLATPAGD